MRITYDFYQRCTKLPADQIAKATALKVYLFGRLSATGKGHGTERASLADIVYDASKGDFPHPTTMTCKLMGGDAVLLEQESYSVGGGFIEWKGYQPPKKGQPKYPYATMVEAMALTAKEMNSKYKETSEGGLAVSVVLC